MRILIDYDIIIRKIAFHSVKAVNAYRSFHVIFYFPLLYMKLLNLSKSTNY